MAKRAPTTTAVPASRSPRAGPGAGRAEPLAPFRARLARLAEALPGAGVETLLVTNPKDVGYLTGFLGGDSYLLLPAAGGRPTIVSDFRYAEELEPVRAMADVVIRRGGMTEAVVAALGGGRGPVGIQAEHVTVLLRGALAKGVGAKRLVETAGLVARLRVIKDASEIALIRRAVKIQQDALESSLGDIEPGMSELEIAAMIEEEMKVDGSSAPGFETIVAAGANGSFPHYRPGAARLKRGSTLLIDWGATWRGYHADMTRVIGFGRWPAKIAEIYRIVLEAQEAAAAALAPGKTTLEIDAIARAVITGAGYGEAFGHGLGHGIGLDGHEDPRVSHMAPPVVLEEGMVVTVEPGIYLPGVGGVRLEDDYAITGRGATNLCSTPKGMEWASRG